MRKGFVAVVGATALLVAVAAPSMAGPNCGLVKKDLAMGRTAEDISERMMVSVDEVKKCQEADGAAAGAPAAAAPAGEAEKKPADEAGHEGHGH